VTPGPTFLLDVNVLVALTNPDHVHHGRATAWFESVASWATCPTTEAAFLRLMMNPAVAGRAIDATEALGVLAALRALPGHRFLADDTSLADPAIDLIGLRGHRQVTDLHLVNLAARNGAVLATFDGAIASALVGDDKGLVTLV
jgi:toxin-antitoxin system PIN domain toxin